jgi:predicted Rossmann-fold nucleotide-binding protein
MSVVSGLPRLLLAGGALNVRRWSPFLGGYGTFDELFEVLTLYKHARSSRSRSSVGESYWRRAVNLDFMVDEGVIDEEGSRIVLVCRNG